MKKHSLSFLHLLHTLSIILGLVLVWRGVWYGLDYIDQQLFDGSHWWTVLIGTIIGFVILYLPDKDLKEIEKL
jgi:hypothetical protein